MNLLSRREHGRAELFLKLKRKGHEIPEIEQALDDLERLALLDDRRAAQSLARYYAETRGYGPRGVTRKLMARSLPRALVENVVDELDVDWERICRELSSRHTSKGRERLLRFLLGRGYPASLALTAVSELLDRPASSGEN